MGLTADEARALRMSSLLLAGSGAAPGRLRAVADVVDWFGAMQAQDYDSGLWSLGCRLPGWSRADVERALEERQAVRTWPMRGTVHLVPARDARWMVDLMGSRALARGARRRAALGLADVTADRAVDILAEALGEHGRLTRTECVAALESAGIPVAGQRAYHLLLYASLRGVLCLAPNQGTEQVFVLLDSWVPDPRRPDRDEALATIAGRYVRSHGPVTRRDFIGWTGLTASDADRGLALAADSIAAVDVEGVAMRVAAEALDTPRRAPARAVLALPGFDEYLLGFKDRALMLDPEDRQAVVPGGSGTFLPTVVRDGQVVGTWRRIATRARTVVMVRELRPLSARDRRAAEAAFARYADYLGAPVETRWASG